MTMKFLWLMCFLIGAPKRSTHALLFSKNDACCRSPLFSHSDNNSQQSSALSSTTSSSSLDDAVKNRYACTRFQRYDNRNDTVTLASPSDPDIVHAAFEALDLARRAPSGFNIQPYKLLLVHSPEQKAAMARYCIGRNAHRVRDSDCTAIFLADRQVVKTFGTYRSMLFAQQQNNNNGAKKWKDRPFALLKAQVLIALFSSGFPLPKLVSGPISWALRVAMRVVSWCTRGFYPVPTLSSSETWSQKNTMLVAMTYLLACTSKNIATCPMEGYTAWGIRQALNIPRRYTIPLIVATGRPYVREAITNSTTTEMDDAGMTHGPPTTAQSSPRFSNDETQNTMMIYGDLFGQPM